MEAFLKTGIISGHPDESVRPGGTVTRAEAVALRQAVCKKQERAFPLYIGRDERICVKNSRT